MTEVPGDSDSRLTEITFDVVNGPARQPVTDPTTNLDQRSNADVDDTTKRRH